VRKLDAEHVEAMWNLPTCGVLWAGLYAAGIIVRVRRPGRVGLPAWRWRRLQTDAARAMPSPPRGWRGPPSPRLTGRSMPAKG